MNEKPSHTKSSGNIFRDLEFERPEDWKTKAFIAAHILRLLEERDLTQAAAATLFGVSQPEVSNLNCGQLDRFTVDRLFRFLRALDQHVHISIMPQDESDCEDWVTIDESS